jgi:hypothetical protein
MAACRRCAAGSGSGFQMGWSTRPSAAPVCGARSRNHLRNENGELLTGLAEIVSGRCRFAASGLTPNDARVRVSAAHQTTRPCRAEKVAETMNSLSEVEQKNKTATRRHDPLAGLPVKLPEQCRCGSEVALIGAGTEIHRASLRCRSCGRHRGWLSKITANWIETVAVKFGAPEIITLRGPRL